MNTTSAFIAVLLMALVTYLPRVLPIAIFRREIKSRYIRSFLHYVPYAVIGVLTFPDIFTSTGNLKTSLCGFGVAIFLAYKEKSLVLVALGGVAGAIVGSLLLL